MGGRGASSGLTKKSSKSNTDMMSEFRNAGTIVVDKEVKNLNSIFISFSFFSSNSLSKSSTSSIILD